MYRLKEEKSPMYPTRCAGA